jgi:pimeloyl-ACP methyl ester carboxylesterase
MQGSSRLRATALACVLFGALATSAGAQQAPKLDWQPCGDAPNVVCTKAKVPLDYGRPNGQSISLFVAKSPATDQAHRLGTLFFNFGGPGGSAANYVEAVGADPSGVWGSLNTRYDIVGMDPRGVGQSEPSIDCKANQETQGIYGHPFTTPDNLNKAAQINHDLRYDARCIALNKELLPHVSTANVARDLDVLRQAVGERKLTYFGFSYGTFLGATYASMFPHNYDRMVLDGPVDADAYINEPLDELSAQSDGFERAIGRFFQACAIDQGACSGFGGSDPWDAFDQLIDKANASPIPAGGDDPRPVNGDDILTATLYDIYAKQFWGELAKALADAANGDGTGIRVLVDGFYGNNLDGTFDPGTDRYFTIGAIEQRYPHDPDLYFRLGKRSWTEHEHTWWNNGYVELYYGLWPIHDRDAYDGPFKIPNSSPTPLVVATTYDPATPYRGAKNLVRDLGNARLLTMRGDGHTAYGGNSPCIDSAVDTFMFTGALPAAGTTCKQDVPFEAPQVLTAQALKVPQIAPLQRQLHMKPLLSIR